jgi:hypothetical protein
MNISVDRDSLSEYSADSPLNPARLSFDTQHSKLMVNEFKGITAMMAKHNLPLTPSLYVNNKNAKSKKVVNRNNDESKVKTNFFQCENFFLE